ncbi:peptidase U32 family protein [Gorillibacterium massiliense]|uniref:peptidase U32 family protein n=1 Tax=Gorillibacterium massiliense TaxID=1280390 RepID=UPI0005926FD8|nr:U32 family peptidase [Gorillibacterium massiliense]
MARYFNGKEIELLAPAGTFEIFEAVVQAPCDAVYFGGPSLNMRLIRKGYNFSYEEIVKAITIAHDLGKKAYITVNNLLSETDVEEAKDYLRFLESAAPDALIVQDFAVLALVQELGITIPMHASVMMNVHNLEMIRALQEMGVTRAVTSREMDLQTARLLQEKSGIELEYFIHGDMCSVHGANCYFSSQVFGMSSNRGKCLKPCRWDYRVKKDGHVYPTEYPLAVKDMYMYEHLPELIESGVMSFKIEGRMRDKEFMLMLVNAYGDALDRYLADPVGFERAKDSNELYENRKRDFFTAYAFGNPGLSYINRRYEGTGKFYSTGKVFSTPTEERELSQDRVGMLRERLAKVNRPAGTVAERGQLAVRVNNMVQAQVALEASVDYLYLSGDVFEPDKPFTKADICRLGELKGKTKLILGLPRMMREIHFSQYDQLFAAGPLPIDGVLATNVGAIRRYKDAGYPLVGDVSLNVFNHVAADLYARLGLDRVTLSPELTMEDLSSVTERSNLPLEAVVHGSPALMYMDLDLYENTEVLQPIAEEDNHYVDNSVLVLMTDKGENPVYRDQHGRCHLMFAKELNLLPLMKELKEAGVSSFRIEGATYKPEQLRDILAVYRQALDELESCGELFAGMKPNYAGYTLGALQF